MNEFRIYSVYNLSLEQIYPMFHCQIIMIKITTIIIIIMTAWYPTDLVLEIRPGALDIIVSGLLKTREVVSPLLGQPTHSKDRGPAKTHFSTACLSSGGPPSCSHLFLADVLA